MTNSLQDLVNRAIFMSTESQMRFEQLIGDRADDWDADFSADPTLTFGQADEQIVLRPHLIGSADDNYGTWRWGWSSDNDWPQPVVDLSHEVRKFGAAQGLAEFGDEEFNAQQEDALRLTIAAKLATGQWTHFPLPVGKTSVWLLIDSAPIPAPEPGIRSIVKAIAAGLTLTEVTDHEAALRSYAELRGFPLVDLEDGTVRILAADGSADVTFDTQHRLTNCQVHQPLEGEAQEQFAAATSGAQSAQTAKEADMSSAQEGAGTQGRPDHAAEAQAGAAAAQQVGPIPGTPGDGTETHVGGTSEAATEPASHTDAHDEKTVERDTDVLDDSTTTDAGEFADGAEPDAAKQDASAGDAGPGQTAAVPEDRQGPQTVAPPPHMRESDERGDGAERGDGTETATHADTHDENVAGRDTDVLDDSTTTDAGEFAGGPEPDAAKQDTAASPQAEGLVEVPTTDGPVDVAESSTLEEQLQEERDSAEAQDAQAPVFSDDDVVDDNASETSAQKQPEKKGFFRKLFGR